ncbi:type 4a pilus biogenesis protein PilO [Thalassolituus oleivorans]|jgi:type IV pilus assembly protein PilO|uniref:Type IV pilus biogenesis protein PilO n=1 Tax=hydrothermal vent metagenome TaxID=652676 RepID=A0A160TA03_9ZZZZ|nr:type 4a pilus biogenesis protein PilO [Thalassolituus oleivorans]AHK16802.1 pilus biosynthesis protein PilO [Thalassolituus oleivorans R6-15]PCI49542.1 MAG: pilus assembly protein PilP [Oceanospirillales bacterium]PHQ87858.1 MAG: pilus assembly protein PilP [Thalassobium sp.]|tara:strand:+ start:1729 stop:2367 length:639 start_codon:yes stop_codon:yes gene_type:complete
MADVTENKSFMAKLNEIQLDDINNIDWNNTGSWPLLGKVALSVVLFVAVCAGMYFLMVQEDTLALDREQKKELALKKDFESKAFRVANLAEYKAQMAEMEFSFGSLLKQLPRDTEVPGLIDDISAAALNAGLQLNAIDPQKMQKTEFYNELPIDIEVVGDYHEMGAFVSGVASLPRIVTLHDFSVERKNNSSDLSMKILAKTYQYGGDEKGE